MSTEETRRGFDRAMRYHAHMQFEVKAGPAAGAIGTIADIDFDLWRIGLKFPDGSYAWFERENTKLVNHDPCDAVSCTARNEVAA